MLDLAVGALPEPQAIVVSTASFLKMNRRALGMTQSTADSVALEPMRFKVVTLILHQASRPHRACTTVKMKNLRVVHYRLED